jgi:hypothetical protein
MDEAVRLWQKAGEYKNGRVVLSKMERRDMYRRADDLAGCHKALMVELTRRGIITWAF